MTGNETKAEWPGVVFLGDSFVESIYVAESDRFVSQLERSLHHCLINIRCLNGGYSGSTTLQLLNVLLNKIVPLIGKGGTVVFFVPVGSDLPIYFRPHSYWYPTDRYSPVLPPSIPASTNMPHGVSALSSLLRLVAATAEEFELNLIFVASPHREAERSQDPYLARMLTEPQDRSIKQRHRAIHAAISRVAAETGTPMLDAASAFAAKPEAFYDEVHLNELGQKAFSEWLYEEIKPILLSITSGVGIGAFADSKSPAHRLLAIN